MIIKIVGYQISIRELCAGSTAILLGYKNVYGGYIGKLVAKGLTLGKTLTILDTASSEGRVKVMLEGKIFDLSKPEADALCVRELNKWVLGHLD